MFQTTTFSFSKNDLTIKLQFWLWMESLRGDVRFYFQTILTYGSDVDLENNILKWHAVPSNISHSTPLDKFLRRMLKENIEYAQVRNKNLFWKKTQQ